MKIACLQTESEANSYPNPALNVLAQRLNLPVLNAATRDHQCDFYLSFTSIHKNTNNGTYTDIQSATHTDTRFDTHIDILQIHATDTSRGGAVFVDFDSDAMLHRLQTSGIRQDIAKAVGCKGNYRPTVLDATAGLGKDAFILASLGCHMTLLESHPVVYELLANGISRAVQTSSKATDIVANHMQLLPRQDAIRFLLELNPQASNTLYDVVYLDPMFPDRSKSAKVKKAMQYFHEIVGFNPEQEMELLRLARDRASKRVVVKRPKLAPLLAGQEPAYQLKGKTVRYDVYL